MKRFSKILMVFVVLSLGLTFIACRDEGVDLTADRTTAIEVVENYKSPSLYRDEELAELNKAISEAILSINSAQTKEDVDKAVAQFKATVDALTTIEGYLTDVKAGAVADISAFVDKNNYYEEQQKQINDLLAVLIENINKALSSEAIDALLQEYKDAVSEIKDCTYYDDLWAYRDEKLAEIKASISECNELSYINVLPAFFKTAEEAFANTSTKDEVDATKELLENNLSLINDYLTSLDIGYVNNDQMAIIYALYNVLSEVVLDLFTITDESEVQGILETHNYSFQKIYELDFEVILQNSLAYLKFSIEALKEQLESIYYPEQLEEVNNLVTETVNRAQTITSFVELEVEFKNLSIKMNRIPTKDVIRYEGYIRVRIYSSFADYRDIYILPNTIPEKPEVIEIDGYVFLGFYINGTEYNFDTKLNSNTVIYAEYADVFTWTINNIREKQRDEFYNIKNISSLQIDVYSFIYALDDDLFQASVVEDLEKIDYLYSEKLSSLKHCIEKIEKLLPNDNLLIFLINYVTEQILKTTIESDFEKLLIDLDEQISYCSVSGLNLQKATNVREIEIYYNNLLSNNRYTEENALILEQIYARAIKDVYEADSPNSADIIKDDAYLDMRDIESLLRVSFNPNNGDEYINVYVNMNDTVEEITNLVYVGYEFKGWYLYGELFNFSTPITNSIDLEAKWEFIINDAKEEYIEYLLQMYEDVKAILPEAYSSNVYYMLTYYFDSILTLEELEEFKELTELKKQFMLKYEAIELSTDVSEYAKAYFEESYYYFLQHLFISSTKDEFEHYYSFYNGYCIYLSNLRALDTWKIKLINDASNSLYSVNEDDYYPEDIQLFSDYFNDFIYGVIDATTFTEVDELFQIFFENCSSIKSFFDQEREGKYVVYLNVNGTTTHIFVEKDTAIENLEDPQLTGYVFMYWMYNDQEFDIKSIITEDIYLYAYFVDEISYYMNLYIEEINNAYQAIENELKFYSWYLYEIIYTGRNNIYEASTLAQLEAAKDTFFEVISAIKTINENYIDYSSDEHFLNSLYDIFFNSYCLSNIINGNKEARDKAVEDYLLFLENPEKIIKSRSIEILVQDIKRYYDSYLYNSAHLYYPEQLLEIQTISSKYTDASRYENYSAYEIYSAYSEYVREIDNVKTKSVIDTEGKYIVVFYVDNFWYDEQYIKPGEFLALPREPQKDWHNFLYWSNLFTGKRFYFDTPINKDLTLEAVFEIKLEEYKSYCIQTIELQRESLKLV